MLWTEEAIEVLKRLALEGRSASVIAAALGASSRSAVIGKANRIGIKLNGGGRAAAPAGTAAVMNRAQSAAIREPPSKKRSSAASLPPRVKPREERKAAWTPAEAEVREMRRVRPEEIREFACRWPVGDPRSGDFVYCGLEPAVGHSYCAGHCRIAYQPPKARTGQAPPERRWSRATESPWRLR